MSKAATLTDAIVTCLSEIAPDAGYHTQIMDVYGAGKHKPDKAALPCIVLRLEDDSGENSVGTTAKRTATYIIEAVFPRSASLQDLQRCHHDILKSLGFGQAPQRRPLSPGWVGEESVQFDLAEDGGSHVRAIAAISIQYVEQY